MASSLKPFHLSIKICLFFNLLASLGMVLFLKPGIDPALSPLERVRFLANAPMIWTGTWVVWIFAALSLISFFIHWGQYLGQSVPKGWLVFGVVLGCLGMVPDTLAETLYIGWLPRLAGEILLLGEADLKLPLVHFQNWEGALALMTGFLGNGFYALGGLVLNILSLRSAVFPKKLALAGLPIWFFALGLSVSTLGMWRNALIITTALTMGSFILWLFLLSFFQKEGS